MTLTKRSIARIRELCDGLHEVPLQLDGERNGLVRDRCDGVRSDRAGSLSRQTQVRAAGIRAHGEHANRPRS